MDDTATLRAIEDIKVLKAKYFRMIDTKQWDAWEKLFMPDVVAECPDDFPGSPPVQGSRMLAESTGKMMATAKSVHHGHMPEIEILSPTTARGVWVMQDWVNWSDTTKRRTYRTVEGWGHYHETYTKTAEGWRIATLKLTRLRLDRS